VSDGGEGDGEYQGCGQRDGRPPQRGSAHGSLLTGK
jgi:hypothetical protein